MQLSDLTRDNARLRELESAYAAMALPFKHSLWQKHQNEGVSIDHFRADGSYLGAGTGRDDQYRIMFDYVVSIDKFGFLDRLTEDREFGIETYEFDGKLVSRDLLDSIMEIYFLIEAFEVEGLTFPNNWIDIGAGYGRFAYRLDALYPVRISCIDAVAVSTFLCDFYIRYRQCSNVNVIPLTGVNNIWPGYFDIACNIHSWSECSSDAINFWLDKLVEWGVPHLFVVPHDTRWVCVEPNGFIGNFQPLIEAHGFTLRHSRSKYPEGVNGLYPEVNYFLFGRS